MTEQTRPEVQALLNGLDLAAAMPNRLDVGFASAEGLDLDQFTDDLLDLLLGHHVDAAWYTLKHDQDGGGIVCGGIGDTATLEGEDG